MTEAWRTVRVFVSSTFRDMQAERDHLVRFVFPRIREELLKRRIHFVDVDLRWGVTADQDAFDLCMQEIEQCHPRFLCVLGGRYGWIPPPKTLEADFVQRLLGGDTPLGPLSAEDQALFSSSIAGDGTAPGEALYAPPKRGSALASGALVLREKPRAVAEMSSWNARCNRVVEILLAAGYPGSLHSITAAEIFHGALDRLDVPTFRFFYFRDPAVTEAIPPPDHEVYRERPGSRAAAALQALKKRISESTGVVPVAPGRTATVRIEPFQYPCRWDPATRRIVDLQEFGERVYTDLLGSVDAEFGTGELEHPGKLAEENAVLEAFIQDRVERFVLGSRRPVMEALMAHAHGSGEQPILCLVGKSGSGKSALLGKFLQEWGLSPHPPRSPRPLVVSHFVGINSTDLRETLWRLCSELAAAADGEAEVPTGMEELRKLFPQLLEKAAEPRTLVLVLDAVNQFDPTHQAHTMTWLPDPLPPGVRVVLSTLPGPVVDALRRRRHPPREIQLGPLEKGDANAIVDGFLHRYRKSLDSRQRNALLKKEAATNPLYLVTALEELRTLGIYEEITTRIQEIPERVRPLFDWILERLETDPGFRDDDGNLVGRELVRRYCSYLCLGRRGMAQTELAALVARADETDESRAEDPGGNVAALRALLRPYLMARGDLLDFFHGQLREAVEERYLRDPEQRRTFQADIAEYFLARVDPEGDGSCTGDSIRGLSELPYHLTEAEDWERVTDLLTNFAFLERKVAEVGVVETFGPDGAPATTYTGVYLLQEDYDHALEKIPGGQARTGARKPIVLTAVDFGDGYVIRCPFCNTLVPFQEEWSGQEMTCPEEGCGGPWKVNPFKAVRPGWAVRG